MATSWRLSNRESGLPKQELIAKLVPLGISVSAERAASSKEQEAFQLTDGSSFMWAYPDEDGRVSGFEVFVDSANNVRQIVDAIEQVSGETMLSEHDDGFFDE
jgi:hypothetical protein